ncbi:MAG TPA: DUF4337 family protein [Candidatus Elarobacter sp.]|jgi:hypothetical protein|nr:DUF4337 family protein [Candidatus Elarobacter sp.]
MSATGGFEAAHEKHAREPGHDGPRWIPIAAAVLAVLAAVSSYFGNRRSTQALFAKNEAIVATTHASDTFAQYQAERLKFYVSQSALDQGVGPGGKAAKLRANAERENAKGPALLRRAQGFDQQADAENARSERLLGQAETIEVGSTLFEVGIVLVSISTLVASRLLPITAGVAAVGGVLFFLYGLVAR